jgi:hypothetical protein
MNAIAIAGLIVVLSGAAIRELTWVTGTAMDSRRK